MMFGTLHDSDVDWFTRVGVLRRFPVGESIITERQPTSALFIILDGRALVTVKGVRVARVAAGEILGEVSLVDTRLPTASVVPESETTVLQIEHSILAQKLRADQIFGCRFYHALSIVLAQRLRRNTPGGLGDGGADGDDVDDNDDVDADLLENISLAGLRFDQLLKRSLRAD